MWLLNRDPEEDNELWDKISNDIPTAAMVGVISQLK